MLDCVLGHMEHMELCCHTYIVLCIAESEKHVELCYRNIPLSITHVHIADK